jgi:hypothetical protein
VIKNFIWKALYSRWNVTSAQKKEGYSLLLMVPGDLPVFLQIAMEQCSFQVPEHLLETVVVPDNIPPGFMKLFDSLSERWKLSPICVAPLSALEYFMTKRMNNPHLNCWLQFVRGCNAVSSTHLLWHDADLFIADKDFLKKHFVACVRQRCALLGMNESWDSWYRENGFAYLTSTWEIMVDLAWVKSFPPWQHRGHDGRIAGKSHTFDITFLPQCLTPPEKIKRHEGDWGFVHFNYVIATYRHFQNSRGSFEDEGFKLLLVRLLVDAYDRSGWQYEVPLFEDLLPGIKDASRRVTYVSETARKNYPEFRTKFQKLVDSGITGPKREAVLRAKIQCFDKAFGWTEPQ